MTIWCPDLEERPGPRYLAIADALEADVDRGALRSGDRLPTHRELARRLSVTVGTVSRAYAEAERRGLVRGEVGRGTFVRGFEPLGLGTAHEEAGLIEMGASVPASPLHDEEDRVLREAFEGLARSRQLPALLGSQPHAGIPHHRAAGATWLRRFGVEAQGDRVLVCNGGQHAMAVSFATLTRPGDLVMTEALTFSGMKGLANLMHLRLEGLPMDDDGLDPEAFERACRRGESKLLYTIPTHHNPTAVVMPEARRHRLIETAERYGVTIVEDDIYGFLPADPPPPLVALAPERVLYIRSVSKIVVPGLRVGFMAAPESLVERLAAGIWATSWMASGPMAEIVARWIDDGTLDRFLTWRRDEAHQRNEIAATVLRGARYSGDAHGYYLWLQLPEPWRSTDFVEQARRRGVALTGAESYAAGRGNVPHAVRVAIMAEADRTRLEEGLHLVARLLAELPEPCVALA